MNARGSTEPQEQPPPRRAEAIDPSKLTIRQIRESMTLGQIYGVIAITIAVLAFVATSSYKLGAYLSSPPADTRGAESSIAPATMVPIQPDTIIATHYPTGELFAVDPKSGTLRVISVRLGNPLGLAIRPNGEIIVLESDLKGYKHPRSGDNLYPTGILGKVRRTVLPSQRPPSVAVGAPVAFSPAAIASAERPARRVTLDLRLLGGDAHVVPCLVLDGCPRIVYDLHEPPPA
jgi:hypothetical protein